MITTASSHLAAEKLRAFQAGTLSEEYIAEVEAHLQSCVACCEVLSGLPEDSFLLRVRYACENPPTLLAQRPSSTPPPRDMVTLPETPLETTTGATPPLPGYEIVRELGRGGMGIVYAATHGVMGRRVAIKVIHPEFSSNPVAADRFRREILAASRLSHPNIVTAYDAGEDGGRSFLVMEYIDGETLGDRLNRLGPLPVGEACDAVRQAALGVQHALDHGLIHRDVKPHNLMRTADGTVKVCDFGLAVLLNNRGLAPRATAPNAIMGTPDYMAPEQAEDARSADGRTDVYALGCTLYHLLTGHVPFPEESVLLKLVAHRTQTRPSAGRLRPEIPAELDEVLRRAMARKPAKRYQTPGEFANALEPFAHPAQFFPRPHGRKRLLALAALILSLGAAIAGVVRLPTAKDQDVVIQTDDPEVEVVVKGDRIVRIVDPKTGKAYQLDRADLTLGLADDPDGLTVSLNGDKPIMLKRRGEKIATVRLERAQARMQKSEKKKIGEVRRFEGHRDYVNGVAFTPDGRFALSASGRHFAVNDPSVRLWNVQTGEQVRKFGSDSRFGFLHVTVSRDGRYVFASGYDHAIWMWELATGQLVRKFKGHSWNVFRIAATPDGRQLLSTGDDEPDIRIWDIASGREAGRLPCKGGMCPRLALSANGRLVLAGGDDGVVHLWDLQTRRELHRLNGHKPGEAAVCAIAVSSDNQRVVTAGRDNTLRLWDVQTGRQLYCREMATRFWALQFTPDGRRLLAGSGATSFPPKEERFKVYLLDAATGKEVLQFEGHPLPICSLAMAPDGRHFLSGSWDTSVRLWRMPDPEISPAEKVGEVLR